MRLILPFLLGIFIIPSSFGQSFEQISTGAGYSNQQFYNLDSKTGVTVASGDWDLMFTAFGLQDAGIHINEASASTFGAPAPTVELYLAETSDFESITSFDTTFTRLYNNEESWALGALNVNPIPENPLDYGWGVYNPTTRQVVGDEVFVIKLRSGSFKKFMIESLNATVYNIKHADLDDSNEQTAAIDKNNFPSGFAFFSFDSNNILDVDLSGFDFLFTRYTTILIDPESGDTLDYTVTGILSAPGVEVAKVEGIDPAEVTTETELEFSSRLDALGFDWKNFSFSDGWILPEDRTYIVKTAEDKLYKMVFIDFEGSSTGTATFELSELGTVSSIKEVNSTFKDFQIFPNPVREHLNITCSLKQAYKNIQLELYNSIGQLVWTTQTGGNSGLNARTFVLPNLPMGTYLLNVQAGDYQVSRKVMIQK